jgi:hypothetical protein
MVTLHLIVPLRAAFPRHDPVWQNVSNEVPALHDGDTRATRRSPLAAKHPRSSRLPENKARNGWLLISFSLGMGRSLGFQVGGVLPDPSPQTLSLPSLFDFSSQCLLA